MWVRKLYFLLFLGVFAFLTSSCSKFRRIEKSEDWRVKYEAALNYYDDKDYYHSALLFEQIRPIVRGLPEGEKVEFLLAYCQYYERTYLLASAQFKTFYETYGRSNLAQEAHFMYAYSLYEASPEYNLDQQSSVEAMAAMQTFLNQFPGSEFSERAAQVIVECQKKLERKNYENAKLYLKLRSYKAAIIAFDTFRENFPDSNFLEEVAFLKVEAQFRLATQSLPSLQKERYSVVLDFYKDLIDSYPNSEFLREAEKFYTESLSKVNKLKTDNS
ncbi:MAG TPA: outer membrane protein assembly factor BamD [Cyclobacteriaceae bacterium]|nr:outer membrane protein assembly factor BamD [Cyclobacteriaceae bacterium]